MAAITPDGRQELVALFVTMIGRAPSTTELARMVIARENGSTLAQVATSVSVEVEFALVASMDADSFGTYLANALLAADIPASAREWAINWVITQVQGTKTKAQVIAEAVQAIRATTNSNYASSQTELAADVTAILNDINNPPAPIKTYTLTTSADGGTSVTGGAGEDVFNGVINGNNAAGTTLNPGDNLNGGGGSADKLAVSISGTATTAVSVAGVTLTNIERIEISNFETSVNNHTFDMSGATGVATVALAASSATGDTVVNNLKNLVAAEMSNGAGDLTLGYGTTVSLIGATDAQSLTVTGITGGTFSAGNGFEVFNVTANGSTNTLTALTAGTPTGSNTQTLNVSGTGGLTITNALAATVTKVNASALTGALSITADTTVNMDITGGAGNDTISMTTGLTAADSIDGGAGTDILSITDSLSASMTNIKNIETLRMGGATKTFDVSKISGLTGYQVADATSDITINGLADKASVSFLGNVTGANTLALPAQPTVTNELGLTISNATLGEADGADLASVSLTNVATLNLASTGGRLSTTASATNANNIELETTSSLSKIVVTGDTDLVIEGSTGTVNDGTVSALNSSIKTVDASAFTGRLYVTAAAVATTITGGTGIDSITGGTAADSLSGGAGNDIISGGGGNDVLNGGDGNDSITLGTAGTTGGAKANGDAGNDTITMTSATGLFNINGGAGDDSIVVSGGTTLYLEDTDTVVGGEGTDTLTFAGTNGAAFDLATNASVLAGVSGFEGVKLDVSGLTANNNTLSFTFNDVLASSIGAGTLAISVVDAATPTANAGADVTINASGVLLSSTKVNVTASAAVQYVYHVGGATENVVLGAQADTVLVSNVGFLTANDTINGGTGSDTLAFNYGATSSTAVTFDTTTRTNVSGFETLNLDGVTGVGTGALTLTLTDAFATANQDSSTGTLTVTRAQLGSTTVDDTGTTKITASAVASVKLALSGADGADTIVAGSSDDTITGNGGNDSLTGGAGNDVFMATAGTMGIDTITDMNFGTAFTSVDKINVAGRALTFNSDFDTVVQTSTAYSIDEDVVVITSQSFTDLAAVDTFYEGRATSVTAAGADKLILWQDSLGRVHLSQAVGAAGASAGADGGDEWTLTDLFTFDGLTIVGVAAVVNTGDFVVA